MPVTSRTTFYIGFAVFALGCAGALLSTKAAGLHSYPNFFLILGVTGWFVAVLGLARHKRLQAANRAPPTAGSAVKRGTFAPRLSALIIALLLGQFFYIQWRSAWTNYWLLTDSREGVATITKELWSGHGQVGYTYAVDQSSYTGKSTRNWQDERYSDVPVGGVSVVYYSASHPWLSLLYKPTTLVGGLPVIIIAFGIELLLVITVVNPRSKWALNLGGTSRGSSPG
jgi:hypothetical protein